MDKSVFTKWNKQVDNAAFKAEIEEVKKNGGSGNFKEVPFGSYEVKVNKMELKSSKKGDPMLSVQFKILAGECKGQMIFMNQVVLQPFQIHIADLFLESLATDLTIEWPGLYDKYADLIQDVFEATSDLEYELDYGENDKGYNTFDIVKVYEN